MTPCPICGEVETTGGEHYEGGTNSPAMTGGTMPIRCANCGHELEEAARCCWPLCRGRVSVVLPPPHPPGSKACHQCGRTPAQVARYAPAFVRAQCCRVAPRQGRYIADLFAGLERMAADTGHPPRPAAPPGPPWCVDCGEGVPAHWWSKGDGHDDPAPICDTCADLLPWNDATTPDWREDGDRLDALGLVRIFPADRHHNRRHD